MICAESDIQRAIDIEIDKEFHEGINMPDNLPRYANLRRGDLVNHHQTAWDDLDNALLSGLMWAGKVCTVALCFAGLFLIVRALWG